jgi:hypothetical protein
MNSHHVFRFICKFPDGTSLPVTASSQDITEYMERNYPEVPPNHYIVTFCQKMNAEFLDALAPHPKLHWEQDVDPNDILWITAEGKCIKEAFLNAKAQSESFGGEDAFINLFKRYFVIDGRLKSLETALALAHTYSVANTGTKAVGVSSLESGKFFFYTSRKFYNALLQKRSENN